MFDKVKFPIIHGCLPARLMVILIEILHRYYILPPPLFMQQIEENCILHNMTDTYIIHYMYYINNILIDNIIYVVNIYILVKLPDVDCAYI